MLINIYIGGGDSNECPRPKTFKPTNNHEIWYQLKYSEAVFTCPGLE